MYIIRKTLIPPLSADDDETNYVDTDAEMIVRAPILNRGKIVASDEAGLALHAKNWPWDFNALIDQRVMYVVMQKKLEHTLHGNSLLANDIRLLAVLYIGYSTKSS